MTMAIADIVRNTCLHLIWRNYKLLQQTFKTEFKDSIASTIDSNTLKTLKHEYSDTNSNCD